MPRTSARAVPGKPEGAPATAARRLLLVLALVATALPVAHEVRAQSLVRAASGQVDYYCSLSLLLEQVSNTSPDFERHSNQEQFRIAKQLAKDALPLVHALRNTAPDPAAADVDVVVDGVGQLAEDGDFRVLGLRGGESVQAETDLSPRARRVRGALDRLHAFNTAHCAWRPQPVTGTDFAYPGAPVTVAKGRTTFEFANTGQEIHQMVVVRRNDRARTSLRATLDAYDRSGDPDRSLMRGRDVSLVGQAFAPPGKTDHLVADLKPGEYAMVCLIPMGSTFVSELNEHTGTGPTHFRAGMVSYFTVAR